MLTINFLGQFLKIELIIEAISRKKDEDTLEVEILSKIFYQENNIYEIFERLIKVLKNLEIDFKLICILLLYVMNKNYR